MPEIDDIKKAVCAAYEFEEYGINSYLVHTGYTYHDGDELHIVIKLEQDHIKLTDEGHTMMWLSYEEYNMTPSREDQYKKILSENCVKDDGGRIYAIYENAEKTSIYLKSMIQTLLQVADLRYLTRQNVTNTFIEDVIAASSKLSVSDKCVYNKKIQITKDDYCEPTVFVDMDDPVLIFAINTSERAKETLINIMMMKECNKKYRTIAVIDDNAQITEKDKNRLINRVSRPIIGISDFTETISEYLVLG